jgi:hypothetical protein
MTTPLPPGKPVCQASNFWTAEEVKQWTKDQVYYWVSQFGTQTAQRFKDEEIDGEALLLLEYADFYSMHIPAGTRRKILAAVAAVHGVQGVKPSMSKCREGLVRAKGRIDTERKEN